MYMKNSPYKIWMANYLYIEKCVAKENLQTATEERKARLSPMETVSAVYADKLAHIKDTNHAYSESGALAFSVLLHRTTVKEIFPIPLQRDFELLVGMSLKLLEWCVKEGIILPLIQHPDQYRNLDYLHPLLMQFNPACYEIRDKVIYGYLSGGNYPEYMRKGLDNKSIMINKSFTGKILYREEYESYLDRLNTQRWNQRNAQRYAALASLIGEEELLDFLELEPDKPITAEEIDRVQGMFFDLHRRLLHPITQGLGGLPYNIINQPHHHGSENLNSKIECELMKSVGVNVPYQPTRKMIEKIQESNIPNHFSKLETMLLNMAKDNAIPDKKIEDSLEDIMETLSEESSRIDSKARKLTAFLSITGIGAATFSAREHPEISTIAGSFAPVLARHAVNKGMDIVYKVYQKKYLPWQYWNIKKGLGKKLKG